MKIKNMKWKILFIFSFIITSGVFMGVSCGDSLFLSNEDVIYENWQVRLPEGGKEIYYKSSEASFQGATILAHAIEASMRGKWLYFEGGYNSYPFQFYKDLYWFRATNQTYNKELNKFKDWEELQQYATEADDIELLTGIKFINMYSSKVDSLPNAIDNVKNYVVSKREQANFCYCTAHKSKGLTFKTPTLIEKDFPHLIDWQKTMTDIISMSHIYPDALDKFLKDIEQDVNLAYVAITRAKGDIYLNEDMVKFFNL